MGAIHRARKPDASIASAASAVPTISRAKLLVLALLGALINFGCLTWSTLVEVTRSEDGQHSIGTSITYEFDKNVWAELEPEDQSSGNELGAPFKEQGWNVQTSDGGRVTHISRSAATLDALKEQGWTVTEQALETGRIITASLPFLGMQGTTSEDPSKEPVQNITVLIDESDPSATKYTYRATVVVDLSEQASDAGSNSPPQSGEEESWGAMIATAVAESPEVQKMERALEEAGPPRIIIGAALPGTIERSTINGAEGGMINGNSVQWTIVLDKSGTYNLEATAVGSADLELVIEEGFIGLGNHFRDGVLPFGEPHKIWADVYILDKKRDRREKGKDVSYVFYYDGEEIGQGVTDAEGHATATFSLPETTPEGITKHEIKIVMSKKGLKTVEATRNFDVARGAEKVALWLKSVRGVYRVGDKVRISGDVGLSRVLGLFSKPVAATIIVDDVAVGQAGEDGKFSVEVMVPDVGFSLVGDKWVATVSATPLDATRYLPGSANVEVLVKNKGDLHVTANIERAVYRPDEDATISGMVTAEDKPIAAEVEIVVSGIRLGSVQSGADGRYTYTFKPSSVPLRPTNPNQVPGGRLPSGGFNLGVTPVVPFLRLPMHAVQVSAKGTEGYLGRSAFLYFNVSDATDGCRMERLYVSGLTGNPSVGLTPEQAIESLGMTRGQSLLQLGGEISQGMRVDTGGGDRATFTLLLDGQAQAQAVIAVGGNTTLDVGLYCREPNGKLHVVLRVNKPGQLLVRWPSGTNADLKIWTPTGTVSNVHTEYLVTVDEAGTTSIATIEGTARLSDDQGASVDIEAGKQVTLAEADPIADVVPADFSGEVDPHLSELLDTATISAPAGRDSGLPDWGIAAIIGGAVGVGVLAVLGFAIARSSRRRARVAPAGGIAPPPAYVQQAHVQPPQPGPQQPAGGYYPPAAPNYPPNTVNLNPVAPHSFQSAQMEYGRLQVELASGRLTPQQFEGAVNSIKVLDQYGRYWMLGVYDALWYVYDGRGWVRANPM